MSDDYLLCGCHRSVDSEGRVVEVTTCPFCNAIRALDIQTRISDLDSVLSVSASELAEITLLEKISPLIKIP